MTSRDKEKPTSSQAADEVTVVGASSQGPGRTASSSVERGKQLIGRQLGEYLIVDVIGAGGGGTVFKAKHLRMDRIVALKIIAQQSVGDAEAVKRFQREVRAAAKLMHPNIVTAFDAGEHEGERFLVMEHVEGHSLARVIEERGPLPIEEAIGFILQAALGLKYAHQRRIVHRDIKPGNILVDLEGTIKVLDMGLARLGENVGETMDGGERLTGMGVVLGTVGYMSPEQAMNAQEVDHRSDVYSLGCTLHYLLTAKPIYDGTLVQTIMAHVSAPIPKLCERRPDVPPELDAVFQKMVAKKPEARYASMPEVIEDLERTLKKIKHGGEGPGPANSTTDASKSVLTEDTGESRLARMLRETASGESRLSTIMARIPAVAVDLGTTQSYVAVLADNGELLTVPNLKGNYSTPSIVSLESERLVIGDEAAAVFDLRAHCTADSMKRYLGHPQYPRSLGGNDYPPAVLLAFVLRRLMEQVRPASAMCDIFR